MRVEFRLSRVRERRIARVAELLWEDRLTDVQIAAELGMHRATLARLKKQPDVQALVTAHSEYEMVSSVECGGRLSGSRRAFGC
jgi:DNA-binding transcriptional regulator LsrR (DeoR family)